MMLAGAYEQAGWTKRSDAVRAGTRNIRTRALPAGIDDWITASPASPVTAAISPRAGELHDDAKAAEVKGRIAAISEDTANQQH
jgi:hypothetical protein